MPKQPWLTVNRAGLANTLSEIDRFRIICELIQNALDTAATKIRVMLSKPHYGYANISVEDNDPIGFEKLEDAYEMFGDTSKRDDHTKAGRFTIGEKRFLALCRRARIESTKGGVAFDLTNGQEDRSRINKKRELGTLVSAEVEMTQEQYEFICASINSIIPKEGVELIFNEVVVEHRKPFRTFKAALQTEMANPETRKMQRRTLETEVRMYEPKAGETPTLYELGLPVVEMDCKWHIDVRQRVPLNSDRDNVAPKYKQGLLAFVLNHAFTKLPESEAVKAWVKEARGSEDISKEAFESTHKQIWGENSVVADPSDLESVNRAVAEGYSIVRGSSADEGANNRKFQISLPSSTVFPTPKPYGTSGPPVKVIKEEDYTVGMKLIYNFTKALSNKLLGVGLHLRYVSTTNGFLACFGKRGVGTPSMDYNILRLGKNWFNHGITEDVLSLIIHEFAHYYESNHLSEKYYEACTDLGARLALLALRDPDFFAEYIKESREPAIK
jgi:hypothetical protein